MSGCGVVVGAARAESSTAVTEQQIRHAVEQLVEMVVVVAIVTLVAWALLLACGVLVDPLLCAAVSGLGYYVFSLVRDRRRRGAS